MYFGVWRRKTFYRYGITHVTSQPMNCRNRHRPPQCVNRAIALETGSLLFSWPLMMGSPNKCSRGYPGTQTQSNAWSSPTRPRARMKSRVPNPALHDLKPKELL